MSKKLLFKMVTGLLSIVLAIGSHYTSAQTQVIDKKSFFSDDRVIEMTLVTDLRKLIGEKLDKGYEYRFQPATITCFLPDSTKVTEEVEIRARGDFRREECHIPPILINFKTPYAVTFKKLGRLKLVWPCDSQQDDEQLVLKEYLVYKMYNLLTEKSFRVRLVKIQCSDSRARMKRRTAHGFFIEDVDDMARRSDCREIESIKLHTEQTDRKQATLAALFQYMIGNTDWAVSVYHNIKLIRSRQDSLTLPFLIPYDFDGSGLVNAGYALPAPELSIVNVRQRLYRGFERTVDELQSAMQILRSQRKAIDSLVVNCILLSRGNKKEMIDYLAEFYKITEEDKSIKELFIRNARRE